VLAALYPALARLELDPAKDDDRIGASAAPRGCLFFVKT